MDDFVKDVMHGIAENTESQRKAREELQVAGSDLLAALEQPLEQRMQEGASSGSMQPAKRSQQDMKAMFMEATTAIPTTTRSPGI